MVVRVDLNKCTSLLRAVMLEKMARRHLGPVTAAVYGAVLQSLGSSAKYIPGRGKRKADSDESDDEDEDLPSVSDAKVMENVDVRVNLDATIKHIDKLTNGVGNRKRPHVLSDDPDEAELGIKREVPSDHEDEDQDTGISALKKRNKKLAALNDHLNLLAEHQNHFLIRRDGKHESRIDLTSVTDSLIRTELDAMVHNRYGKHSMRIVRLLREKGKLADTQIVEYCMLDQKYLRSVLTKLQFDGILEIQEIPRDNMRQPSRTLYLWSLNEQRLESVFLQQTYQTMSRLLQRMQAEREGRFRAVIERAEHISEKGREEKEFGLTEREMLKQWREIEEKIMVQLARCDDLVAVLRDFREDEEALHV
jgi:DNA-directed RNA polymerase III subunit RPC3